MNTFPGLKLQFTIFLIWIVSAGCSDDEPSIVFLSEPPLFTDHNREYQYVFSAEGSGGSITYEVVGPSWLELDEANMMLHGIPDWHNLNNVFNVELRASDGNGQAVQEFTITVQLGEIICDQDFGDPTSSPYILPFKSGESYLVNQSYCPSNPGWGHHNWFAYDFEMPIGTDIVAMRGGEVIQAQETFSDGTRVCGEENFIFIWHNDGTVAVYYHLTRQGVEVEIGQRVQQGDIIGRSGDSGCSIGPHLHVNLFRNRGPNTRHYSLPFNFSNADGPLDKNRGLIYNEVYTAL